MPRYSDFAGVIFDVDDTLLDNKFRGEPSKRLHSMSRMMSFREVGRRRGIAALQNVTVQQSQDAWIKSKIHSLEGATWTTLLSLGIVDDENIDYNNDLLKEIVRLKDELHEKVLREEGEEVPGASAFVRALAANGFKDRMSIASTAVRRDIDIFLELTGLTPLFPPERIIAKDLVKQTKPHPEVYNRAFASLGIPASMKSRILAFEDDPRGIMAAKAAGMQVFAITTCFDKADLSKTEPAPDLIADSYAEFATLLGLPVKGIATIAQ